MSLEIIGITVFIIIVFLLIQVAKMRGHDQTAPEKPADLPRVSNELPDISGEPLSGHRMNESSRIVSSETEV